MTNEQFLPLLPEEIRDFHDQKDFFKAMYAHYSTSETKIPGTWVDNHIFTVDFFLWFMAMHGYRLQRFKSRKFEQYDLSETIQHYNNKRTESFACLLKEVMKPSNPELVVP